MRVVVVASDTESYPECTSDAYLLRDIAANDSKGCAKTTSLALMG
jgi:hypothetical protein